MSKNSEHNLFARQTPSALKLVDQRTRLVRRCLTKRQCLTRTVVSCVSVGSVSLLLQMALAVAHMGRGVKERSTCQGMMDGENSESAIIRTRIKLQTPNLKHQGRFKLQTPIPTNGIRTVIHKTGASWEMTLISRINTNLPDG